MNLNSTALWKKGMLNDDYMLPRDRVDNTLKSVGHEPILYVLNEIE
jgi:hypothetical protein